MSIFAFACFTISQILPPLLPVALVIGHTKSSERLKEKDILCVQPKRIAISGKIHAFCFDKTGTLTKQGLDFIGVRPVADTPANGDGGREFSPNVLIPDSPENESWWAGQDPDCTQLMTCALATCHAVTTLREEDGSTR